MNLLRISALLTLLFSTTFSLAAADLGQIKNEMKKRQPAIEALWAAGTIGENNQGYIEARSGLTANQTELVNAENEDRKIVYLAIARSTQTTPDKVGVQRAAQISERAAKGVWLEDAGGKWYKK